MKVLTSEIDESVNFIVPYGEGMLEARYVRRAPDYFICYLSSQSGCKMGCSFCHLTTTKQTSFEHARYNEYMEQAERVIEHYQAKPSAKIINYNFMARGEPFANPNLIKGWKDISQGLSTIAEKASKLFPRFNISTIMPKTDYSKWASFKGSLAPTIYYSFYSTDREWRKKWLPGAMDYDVALDSLVHYQQLTQKIVYIHGAFIKGENDNLIDVCNMLGAIEERNLIVKWNIVRYNPFSPVEGEESDRLENIRELIASDIGASNVPIVSRLDKSTFAPCGMFYSGEIYE